MQRDQPRDFLRTHESPLDFARLRALSFAPMLGAGEPAVNEAFGVLSNAFGVEWLNAAANDISPGQALPFARHPIGRLVATAGLPQVAELVELAGYLAQLAYVPGIEQVITSLKSAYPQTLFQLAFASLCMRAGAQILRLEPEAAGGRLADLDVVVDGQRAHAECFRPTYETRDPGDVHRLAQQALEATADIPAVVSVAIQMHTEVTAVVRRQVVRAVRRLINELSEFSRDGGGGACRIEREALATISVCRSTTAPPGDQSRFVTAPGFLLPAQEATVFIRRAMARASDLAGVGGRATGHETGSHVALWLLTDGAPDHASHEASLEVALQRIGRKIERKVAQTRGVDGDALLGGRIVAVDASVTGRLHAASAEQIARLRGKVVEAHEGIAALLMMQRVPRIVRSEVAGERHAPFGSSYRCLALTPADGARVPHEFIKQLLSLRDIAPVPLAAG
jgi:hypothetical protein